MPSVSDLNELEIWVANEFAIEAREYRGWLLKGVGVEFFFNKRKGVLEYLQDTFLPASLLLRSFPDLLLRGRAKPELLFIEVKGVGDRPNVAIEAWQYEFLLTLFRDYHVPILYLFGWCDGAGMTGHMIPVDEIPAKTTWETARYRDWPEESKSPVRRLLDRMDGEYRESTGGSDDPYITFSREHLATFPQVRQWLDEKGHQGFSRKDRIAWEGREESKQHWRHLRCPVHRVILRPRP